MDIDRNNALQIKAIGVVISTFETLPGRRARRALLLTATPFQLRPAEMLEILKVGDHLRMRPTDADSAGRRARLTQHRENVIRPILDRAATWSRRFAKAWSKLPFTTTIGMIDSAWNAGAVTEARSQLLDGARRMGMVRTEELNNIIDAAVSEVDPNVRQLVREGLRVFVYNSDLSHELGAVVIRHRRHTGHRLFRVGREYQPTVNGTNYRPDRNRTRGENSTE